MNTTKTTEKGKRQFNEPRSPLRVIGRFDSYFEVKSTWGVDLANCGHEFGPGVVYALKKGSPSGKVCPACWALWKAKGGGRCPRATDLSANYRHVNNPKMLQGTSQPAPAPVEDDQKAFVAKWLPPLPPTGPETFTVALTEEEIKFIVKAMVHSASVHRCFCKHGDKEYPFKETNAYIDEVNRLRKVLESAR